MEPTDIEEYDWSYKDTKSFNYEKTKNISSFILEMFFTMHTTLLEIITQSFFFVLLRFLFEILMVTFSVMIVEYYTTKSLHRLLGNGPS